MTAKITLTLVFFLLLHLQAIPAQTVQNSGNPRPDPADTLHLTLDEAVRIALSDNFNIRREELAVETARQQVREAWGTVYPQLSGSFNYQRNVITANPFAGAEAGGLFAGLGAIDWLQYNEQQRLQGEEPIAYEVFLMRQQQGYQEAGITPPGETDDPFGVDNEFTGALSLTQTLFNGAAFSAIKAADQFREVSANELERQTQEVINQVRSVFYSALLTQQQVEVLEESVERIRETVEETERTVEQGIGSKFDRESARVELVNLETELIEARNSAELTVKNLNMVLGIPVSQPVEIIGELERVELPEIALMDVDEAHEAALEMRPDLDQARGAIELGEIEQEIETSRYYPTVSAFADYVYFGRVNDDRTQILTDPNDPFTFRTREQDFFADNLWNPNLSVGVTLQWNIFDGFQREAQLEQARIATREAELNKEQLAEGIRLEIEEAVRNLRTAERRIESQQRNIEQAQLNYDFARQRMREGVGTSLEERQASQQLDQSRLNYLSAMHDYMVALSNFELAIGRSVPAIREDMPELVDEP